MNISSLNPTTQSYVDRKVGPGLRAELAGAYVDEDVDIVVVSKDLNPRHRNGTQTNPAHERAMMRNCGKFLANVEYKTRHRLDEQQLCPESERGLAQVTCRAREVIDLALDDTVAYILAGRNELDRDYITNVLPKLVEEAG